MTVLLIAGVVVVAPTAPAAHAENWVLQLGTMAGFPMSGTDGFDAVTASPVPSPFTADSGYDENSTNNVIRSRDLQTYRWSLTASNVDADADTATDVNDVTLVQVITPDPVGTAPGLGLTVGDLSVSIDTPQECGGGSGVNVDATAGTITAWCNTGSFTTGEQTVVQISVRPLASAPNGARFSSTQSVSATQLDGTPVAPVPFDLDTQPQGSTIYVTNRTEWNLSKHGFFDEGPIKMDPDGAGPEPVQRGEIAVAVYQLSSDRSYGNGALLQPIVVHDLLRVTDNSGNNVVIPGGEYFPVQCTTNLGGPAGPYPGNYPGTVYGAEVSLYSAQIPGPQQACGPIVRDVPGDGTSGFRVTMPQVNFTPAYYPAIYPFDGASLANGPFYVMSVRIAFFIPLDTIDLGDGDPSGNGGIVKLYNAVGDFDPPTATPGGSNYDTGVEPGYCSPVQDGLPADPNQGTGLCDQMADGSRSDNVIGPTPLSYSEPGTGSSPYKDTWRIMDPGWTSALLLPFESGGKGYDGVLEPKQYYVSRLQTSNGSFEDQQMWMCDVFDNSTAVLADSSHGTTPANAPGQYASLSGVSTLAPAKSTIEYGHIDLSGVDPLAYGLDPTGTQYLGEWSPLTDAADAGCAEDGLTTWYTDPNAVPGGIDEVNVVRARPTTSAPNLEPGGTAMLGIVFQAREHFYGGPNNGEFVPDGTVIADQMNRRLAGVPAFDIAPTPYTVSSFRPTQVWAPEGEQVTVRRAFINVSKRTLQGIDTGYLDDAGQPLLSNGGSPVGSLGQIQAGDSVVWQLTPSIVSQIGGGVLTNVTLTDVLPPGIEYDPVCTAFINNGQHLPQVVQADTPGAGQTTLVWLLGTQSTTAQLGTFEICTLSDALAGNGAIYTNSVTFRADGVPMAQAWHSVQAPRGSRVRIKKSVDHTLDPLDDGEVWTLQINNFSDLLQPATPVFLEVFPWNGDATSLNGGSRRPPSSFIGSNTLVGVPFAVKGDHTTPQGGQFWYTDQSPGSIDQNPDGNLAGNLTDWCTTPDGGTTWAHVWGPTTHCPTNLAATTGFMFRADTDLAPPSDSVNSAFSVTFTLDAQGNTLDNIYTDRFSADSSSFPANQYLRSNIVSVRTPGFQLGDWVWADGNGNGRWDPVEVPVPDGAAIELYRDDDGTPGASAGDTHIASDHTLGGKYHFSGLAAGDYYVRIPATDFQPGGVLDGWNITPAVAGTGNDDLNDVITHDGHLDGGGVTLGGVLSSVVTLSAHHTLAGNYVGDEPIADNTHGLPADALLDRFNNFTLDLGLVGPPAVTIQKDVCTKFAAADCVVDSPSWDPTFTYAPAGATAYWRITVTNTGLQDLYPVALTDPVTPSCSRTRVQPLKVGDSFSFVCAGAPVTEPSDSPRVNVASVDANPRASDPDDTNPADNLHASDDAAIASAVSIGDRVWSDVNRNGLQDAGEPGVAGVTVELLDAAGTTLVATTQTDATGFYSFAGLPPDAQYSVHFVLPAGTTFTTQNAAGSDAADSDADPTTGLVSVTAPASGLGSLVTPDNPTIDAGLVSLDLSLTKTLMTAGPFKAGQTVTFRLVPHNNGPVDALAGWSVTDVLDPYGDLALVSIAGEAGGASTYSCSGLTCTSSVPLASGQDGEAVIVSVSIALDRSDETLTNVAYVAPATSEIVETIPLGTPPGFRTNTVNSPTNNDDSASLYVETTYVSIGDRVWVDRNRDGVQGDPGFEPGLAGVTVNVYVPWDPGNAWDTTTTDLDGYYSFSDLSPDYDYLVEFVLPSGYSFTQQFAGTAANDSNADPVTGRAAVLTPLFGLNATTPGDTDEPTIDAGVVEVDLTVDKALSSASPAHPGETVTFTLTPHNLGGTDALAGWSVSDVLPAGLTATGIAGSGGASSIYTCALVSLTCTSAQPLAAGGTAETILVTATIATSFIGTAHNVAYVSPPALEVPETNPLVVPVTATDTSATPTNNDAQADVTVGAPLYDLALVKTGPATIDGSGTATFRISVLNQGNVPSGAYSVTDSIPNGLVAVSASDGGTIAGNTVTWNLSGLAAGATRTLTVVVAISDFGTRPWVNVAEISSDSAAVYTAPGAPSPVHDADSTPDTDPLDDVVVDQTALPTDEYNDPAVDEDDHDIAPTDVSVVYDLALVKVLPTGQSYKLGSNITYHLVVKNQGNVDSGHITFQDVLPAGLTFVSASDAGLNFGQSITWDVANLAPGQTVTVTVVARMADAGKASYVNEAGIVADGASQYSTQGSPVHDKDSQPGVDFASDPFMATDDVNVDHIPGDEDDSDHEALDVAKVRSDNTTPDRLPTTGNDLLPWLCCAAGVLGTGFLALLGARRRRAVRRLPS